jgi:hypothetical protein
MSCNAIGTGRDRELGGAYRVRVVSAPRVADGCHMIDIDAEAELRDHVAIR